ncbi:MAG: undecaprenyldiphospho-muramoylpentapeptide beta-N-acetylglucosaminyltransferase [Candidatus Neomarinimicrobiota bacterium]
MANNLQFLISGGGTGGHLFPALAIGAEIQRRKPEGLIHYVGSIFGLEADLFPGKNIEFSLLPIRGLQRGWNLAAWGKNSLLPFRLLHSWKKMKDIFRKIDPAVVIGTGGYASAMPLYLAQKQNIPTIIQEQNSYPGITTRRFAEKAKKVCIAFKETQAFIPASNSILTGNPVRKEIAHGNRLEAQHLFGLNPEQKTLFIFGGSQGSLVLNEIIARIYSDLLDADIQILWQTGKLNYPKYEKYAGDACRIRPFIDEMDKAYACADLIISRSGALTISEITLCGKPSILIPFALAAGDHQYRNAQAPAAAGAAVVLTEKDLTGEVLTSEIKEFLANDSKLKSFSAASLALGQPDATSKIVNHILEAVHV